MSLLVWLPLNGSLNNLGLSNIIVTNNGATINNNGKIGKCYSFNGSTNYLLTNYNFYNSQYSVCAWFYSTSSSATLTICCERTAVGSGFSIFLINGKIRIDPGGNSLLWTTNYTYPINTWVHLGITYDGTKISYYINGLYQESANYAIASNYWTNILSIGASLANGSSYGNYLNGRINDVRVYNHCLSQKEVEEISKGLVLHYKLDNNNIDSIETVTYSGEKITFVANNIVPLLNISADIIPSLTKYNIASPTNIRVISGKTSIDIYLNVYNYIDLNYLLLASGWTKSTDTNFITYKGAEIYKGTIVNLYNKFGNGKYIPIYGTEIGKLYILGCWWRSVSATTSNGIKISIIYSDGTSLSATPSTQSANQTWTLRLVLSNINKKIIGLSFSYNSSFLIYMAGLMCIEKTIYDSLGGNNNIFKNDIKKYTLPLNNTIYGGNYNISTGILNKTHEFLTLPTTGWNYANGIFYLDNALPARNSGFYDSTKWYCNQYATAATLSTTTNASNAFADLSIGALSGNYPRRVLIKDSRYTDANSFMSGITTPITIVYDKEIPEVITLSSYQISTLLGINNLFTNNKNIELSYGDTGTKTIYDSSGYNNNGIIVGTANTINDTKRYLLATNMNNTNTANHIESINNIILPNDSITVSCWIKTSSKATNLVFFVISNLIEFGTLNGLGYVNPPSSLAGFTLNNFIDNNWNHVVVIRTGNTFKLYINCIEEIRNGANNYYIHNNSKLYLLNRSYNNSYAANAAISDFRIYTTSLTDNLIKELYNTSVTIDSLGNIHAREYIENDKLNITKTGLFQSNNIYDNNDLVNASILKTLRLILGNTLYEY